MSNLGHDSTLYWIWWAGFVITDVSVVTWLVILSVKVRREVAAILAQENLAYAPAQLNFSYRRPYCFESPLVIYDFVAGVQVPSYSSTAYNVPLAAATPAVYYTVANPPGQPSYTVV